MLCFPGVTRCVVNKFANSHPVICSTYPGGVPRDSGKGITMMDTEMLVGNRLVSTSW